MTRTLRIDEWSGTLDGMKLLQHHVHVHISKTKESKQKECKETQTECLNNETKLDLTQITQKDVTQKEIEKNVTSLWQSNATNISSNKEQIVANSSNEALLNSLLQVSVCFVLNLKKLLK
jgi:CRISPR/Cas system-associated protein endoribonuclease Cas2